MTPDELIAQQKSHLAPKRLPEREIREWEEIAANAQDLSDSDPADEGAERCGAEGDSSGT